MTGVGSCSDEDSLLSGALCLALSRALLRTIFVASFLEIASASLVLACSPALLVESCEGSSTLSFAACQERIIKRVALISY